MTINVAFDTVAASIAGLTISGVTVKDIDEIPEDCTMLGPVLMPAPNFVRDAAMTFETYGSNGAAKINLSYTLHYRYLHVPLGTAALYSYFAGLMAKVALITETIATNDAISGAVDIKLEGIDGVGAALPDPAGNDYFGADIAFRVLEYVQ